MWVPWDNLRFKWYEDIESPSFAIYSFVYILLIVYKPGLPETQKVNIESPNNEDLHSSVLSLT